MFSELYKDLKFQYTTGGFWTKVILFSVLVFIIVNISNSYYALTQSSTTSGENLLLKYLSLSSDWKFDLTYIWVWLSHIFTHQSVMHILFNMLNLYWFGNIVEDLIGKQHAKSIFFESAIVGGVFFILATQFLPNYFGITVQAYGASAAVMGLLLAAATISPNYNLRLILFGNVAIKYIALVFVVIDLLFFAQSSNSGGHMAHIGGALMGYVYVKLLQNGIHLSPYSWFKFNKPRLTNTNRSISTSKPKRIEEDKTLNQDAYLNQLLEKIKRSGLESLTFEEKNFLDQISRK